MSAIQFYDLPRVWIVTFPENKHLKSASVSITAPLRKGLALMYDCVYNYLYD
jgi:hypothetical protein